LTTADVDVPQLVSTVVSPATRMLNTQQRGRIKPALQICASRDTLRARCRKPRALRPPNAQNLRLMIQKFSARNSQL
jgi:hypothetical protein